MLGAKDGPENRTGHDDARDGHARHDADRTTALRDDTLRDRPHGTTTDADVTSRMTGTPARHASTDDRAALEDTRFEHRAKVIPAKTSTAAAFALALGAAALVCALTAVLSPVAVVLGLLAVVLGVVGMKRGSRPGITGRGVGLAGLITGLLGLLLGAAVLVGMSVVVNNEAQLDRVQDWLDDRRADLPSTEQIVEEIPGT